MSKLVTVADPNTPFAYSSVAPAIRAVAEYFQLDYVEYNINDWKSGRVEIDKEARLMVVEAAYLENTIPLSHVRNLIFPNAKIVVLGSDTFYHVSRGSFQFWHPRFVDLWLDLMADCADAYSKFCKTDTWIWSANKNQIDYLTQFAARHPTVPSIDFISVLGKHTLEKEGSYRKNLVDAIKAAGYTFTRGNSDGYNDPDLDKLYRSYLQSKYVLETSSHDNGMRSAKGFRSCVGIALGRLVLADVFADHGMYPYAHYNYDDPNTIFDLAEYFNKNPDRYQRRLLQQQSWLRENTIEDHLIDRIQYYFGDELV